MPLALRLRLAAPRTWRGPERGGRVVRRACKTLGVARSLSGTMPDVCRSAGARARLADVAAGWRPMTDPPSIAPHEVVNDFPEASGERRGTCERCGHEFKPKSRGHGNRRRFCSDRCRLEAWAARRSGRPEAAS